MGLQRNAIEYLEKTAAIFPDKVAFADENTSVTFSELKSMSEALGSEISRLTENQPSHSCLYRPNGCIHSRVFGVLYSGNYYVPIDSHMPVKRSRAS